MSYEVELNNLEWHSPFDLKRAKDILFEIESTPGYLPTDREEGAISRVRERIYDVEHKQTEFTSLDTFEIKNRGTVFVCSLDRPVYTEDAVRPGERVMIDGKYYIIKGVETFGVHRKDKAMGILVENVR